MKGAYVSKPYWQSTQFHFIVLAITWLLLNTALLYRFGMVTNYEATKYIQQANLLIENGSYSTNNFIFYSTEILLIALCAKLKIGLWLVVLLQLLMNALSVYFFYQLVWRFTQHKTLAFTTTLLFLSMFFYHLYNVHLFTESLFFSISIIYVYVLFSSKRLSLFFIVLLLLLLLLLSLTRPTGILFIPPTLFYLIFRFGKKKALPLFILSITGGLVLFYFLLNAALSSGGEFDFLLPYIEEHIICGVPTAQQPNAIAMPVNKNSVEGLWYVIRTNDGLFFRLLKERFIAFWGVRRPFYSFTHNLFICIYFYSVYVFILLGLKKMFRGLLPQTIFLISYIFLVMLTVLLSCDEWHNRFIYSVLPHLLFLATGVFVKKPVNISP